MVDGEGHLLSPYRRQEIETAAQPPESSLGTRYVSKVVGSSAYLGASAVFLALVPRALGPTAFGDFTFLTTFFQRVVGFLGFGTATALQTKAAQRPHEAGLRAFYVYFFLFVAGVTALLAGASFALSIDSWLWPGQEALFVWAAALWALGTWATVIINGLCDAYGLTVRAELVRTWRSLLALGLVGLLFAWGKLTLPTVFLYHYVLLLLLAVGWFLILAKAGHGLFDRWRLSSAEARGYAAEFYSYSHPLVLYSIFALITGVADRWVLQKAAGSVQQGFFGLSFQLGALSFLLVGAMTPLIMREFSVAAGKQDLERISALFRRNIPLFYSVAAVIGVFVAVQADNFVNVLAGSQFEGAAIPVAVMAFYPIHQTYGQLSGSVFYATGQTALYRNIGITTMLLGLLLLYVLVAPDRWGGLGAGATGLAVKFVVLQFITVNVQLYYNARLLSLSLGRFLAHQVVSVAVLLGVGLAVRLAMQQVLASELGALPMLAASGAVYTVLVAGLVWSAPWMFGVQRSDIVALLARVRAGLPRQR